MSASVMRALITAAVFGGLLLPPAAAQAHKVTIFAWVEAGHVHTESKFSAGKRVVGGQIEVFDHQKKKVLAGITDAQGYFAFPVPRDAQSLDVILKAGMGHGNHWMISAQELGAANLGSDDTTPTDKDDTAAPQIRAHTPPLDVDRVERVVAAALDKKLAPIKAQLADRSWGLRDLLGGLGYILGLVGLASYLQYRKERKPNS